MDKLLEGNVRYINSHLFKEQNECIKKSQNPHSVVLSCSDSRLILANIFNVDIGEIFEVRSAGNIVTESVIETIQFAVDNFNIQNISVLSHSKCGILSSVYYDKAREYQLLDNYIFPSIITKYEADELNIIKSIENNCINSLHNIISNIDVGNEIKVYPLYYDISTGKVRIIEF